MVSWPVENQLKLLVAVIEANDNITHDWLAISNVMDATAGGGFTPEAVRQKYAKILKNNGNTGGTASTTTPNSGKNPEPSTPTTATSGKSATGKASTTTAKGKKRKAAHSTIDNEDDFSKPIVYKKAKIESASDSDATIDLNAKNTKGKDPLPEVKAPAVPGRNEILSEQELHLRRLALTAWFHAGFSATELMEVW